MRDAGLSSVDVDGADAVGQIYWKMHGRGRTMREFVA